MRAGTWWQVIRVPLLLALLAGVGRVQFAVVVAWQRLDLGRGVLPWAATVLLGLTFVGVALAQRSHGPVRAVAAVEVVLAAMLALVPPMQWVLWLKVGWLTETVGASTGNAFVPALAVAWLVIAGRSLVFGRLDRNPEA